MTMIADTECAPMARGAVLIIDDSMTVRAIIEQMLAGDRDMNVIASASDIETARAMIVRHRPGVITLDLAMPGIDGMTFLDELADIPHAPVLVVSSHTKEGSAVTVAAIEHGAAACFDKARLVSHARDFRRILRKTARLPK
jgi:chemotaxis response regulator CheB